MGGVKEQELLTGRRASSVGVACGRGRSQISSGQERPTARFQRRTGLKDDKIQDVTLLVGG